MDTLAPRWTVQIGNSLDLLRTLPDNAVDAIVCDPPYELDYSACLRVLALEHPHAEDGSCSPKCVTYWAAAR